MTEGDHNIPPVRMDQVMFVAATMLIATINTSFEEGDDEKTKRDKSWAYLSVFLHQLLMASKHKDIAIKILKALIEELKDAQSK